MNATRTTIADFPHIKPICADDYISLPGQFLDMMSRATWRKKGPGGKTEVRPVPFHAWRYYAALCKFSNRWGESWWRVRSVAAELEVTPEALAQSRRVLLESEYDGVPLAVSYAGGHARSEELRGKRILAKVTWLPHRDRSGWVAPRECACGVVDTPRVSGSDLHCPACGDDVAGAPFVASAHPSVLERARLAEQEARQADREAEHQAGRLAHRDITEGEQDGAREAWERAGGEGPDLISRSDRSSKEEFEELAQGRARVARARAREACTSSETLARPDCPPAARGPGAASPRGGGPVHRETPNALPGGSRPPNPPRVVKVARVEIPGLALCGRSESRPTNWPVSLRASSDGSKWVGIVLGAPGVLAEMEALRRLSASAPPDIEWRRELFEALVGAGIAPLGRRVSLWVENGFAPDWYQRRSRGAEFSLDGRKWDRKWDHLADE